MIEPSRRHHAALAFAAVVVACAASLVAAPETAGAAVETPASVLARTADAPPPAAGTSAPATLSAFETLTAELAPAPSLEAATAAAAAAAQADPPPGAAPVESRKGGLSAAVRSLAIPGWGQLYNGHTTQAAIFGLLELGTWITFASYRTQGGLRQDSSFDTARLFAGIDLEGKDERLRRLVGQYQSSDVYNQYVVRREAFFFIEDPAEREAYIAENSIPPDQAWSWSDFDDFSRYREERRTSELAYQRSRYALGFALVNRVVSAIAAGRTAPATRKAEQSTAVPGRPSGRVEWGLVPGREGIPETRLAWTMGF
jgi:hypothetical protein